jgi:hypothetical protein
MHASTPRHASSHAVSCVAHVWSRHIAQSSGSKPVPVEELASEEEEEDAFELEDALVDTLDDTSVVDATVVPGAPPVPPPSGTHTSATHRSGSAQSSVD